MDESRLGFVIYGGNGGGGAGEGGGRGRVDLEIWHACRC